MSTYKVRLEELLSRVVEVEAHSEGEALEIVHKQYRKEEIILNDGDFLGYTEIEIV